MTQGPKIRWVKVPTADGYHDRATGLAPCTVCGREAEESRYFVVLGQGGTHAVHLDDLQDHPEAVEEDPGFMGVHPIGPECRRKLPPGFVGKRSASASETEV